MTEATTNPPWSALPYLLVLASGVLWGMTFSLARIAAVGGAHPIGLSFWQAAGGGAVLLVFCLLRRRRVSINRAGLTHAVVIAVTGTAIPATFYFYAAPKLPAGVLAITIALVPMLTYALSSALRLERMNARRAAGVVTGFVAIVLLTAPDASLPEPSLARWLILPLAASLFYTVEGVYVDARVPHTTDMAALLTAALIIAALALAPVIFFIGAFVPLTLPLTDTGVAIAAMAVVSSVAYLLFLHAVKIAGAVFASLSGYVITVSGVLWGMFFFSERHSLWVWAALALMLLGMLLVTPRKSR